MRWSYRTASGPGSPRGQPAWGGGSERDQDSMFTGFASKVRSSSRERFGFVSVSVTSWIVFSFLDKRNDRSTKSLELNTKLVSTEIDF